MSNFIYADYDNILRISGLRLTDTSWDDMKFPFESTRRGATNKPDYDYINNGLLFPQNDPDEKTYAVAQFPHAYKLGTVIKPHIHYVQDEVALPIFKLDYRWYKNGEDPSGVYTTLSTTTGAFTYTSGSILQILPFPEIDGSAIDTVSSVLDIILYRDDNVVSGDVLGKEFDIHYEIDSLGSNEELVKGN